MKKIFAGIIFPLLIMSFSCLSSCKEKSTSKQQKITEKEQVKEIKGQIETHVYPLPTSAEVIKMLTDLEVGYMIGISNPVENSKKIFHQPVKGNKSWRFRSRLKLCNTL